MGLPLIVFLLFANVLFADFHSNQILYLIQSGNLKLSIDRYQEHNKSHDSELLQQMALLILDQGYRSDDVETQLLTLYGAGISAHESALYILKDGMSSKEPKLQLVALNFLSRYQNDEGDSAILIALNSPYLIIRLEALHALALKKAKIAVPHIDSLMAKVPKELTPLFPQLYALAGNHDAMKMMKKLLTHPDEKVRVEAIRSAAKHGRDDLLPLIRSISSQHGLIQQEACASAFLQFKDEASIPRLEQFKESSNQYVRLASLEALYSLGKSETLEAIEKMARDKNLFAINVLGKLKKSDPLLLELLKNGDSQVKVNAAFALLQSKNAKCLPMMCEILISDARDFGCVKQSSPGGSLVSYKLVPSIHENYKDNPLGVELVLNIKEEVIEEAVKLPERDFLSLAHTLLTAQQNDLVPVVISALEALKSKASITLLKKHLQTAGAPLIRNYCNLSLYRLKEEGPYRETLIKWIKGKHDENLLFRPLVPWEMRDTPTSYQLMPYETSRLLIDSFEALIEARDDAGIDVLLHAIKSGNQKNKFALAGLLIRACQ